MPKSSKKSRYLPPPEPPFKEEAPSWRRILESTPMWSCLGIGSGLVSTVIPSDYRWVALFSAWPFFVVASITAAIHTNRKWRKMATILGGAAFSGAILLGVFLSIEGISDAFELSPEQQRIIRERAIAPEGGPYAGQYFRPLASEQVIHRTGPSSLCIRHQRKIVPQHL